MLLFRMKILLLKMKMLMLLILFLTFVNFRPFLPLRDQLMRVKIRIKIKRKNKKIILLIAPPQQRLRGVKK